MFGGMKAETQAVWTERIAEWRQSGKSAPEFASDKPYKSSTLVWATSRLRRGGKKTGQRRAKLADRGKRASVAGKIAMAEVVRAPRVAASGAGAMVIEIGGARISVQRGFDGAVLRAIAQALRGVR